MTQTQQYHLTRMSLSGELIQDGIVDIVTSHPVAVLLKHHNISDVSLRYPEHGEVVTYRKAGS